MKQGILVYSAKDKRMDIVDAVTGESFTLGGLHCGAKIDINFGTADEWLPCRIEYSNNMTGGWYGIDEDTFSPNVRKYAFVTLAGLPARFPDDSY